MLPKTNLAALIASEVAPAVAAGKRSSRGLARPRAPAARRAAPRVGGPTLKERAVQLSLYLEQPVYDRLREIAFHERTKLHPLLLEAVDLLLAKRGSPSIAELLAAVKKG